jgi:hypothetical protein
LGPGGLQAAHFLGAGFARPGYQARFPGLAVKLVKGMACLPQFGDQPAGRAFNDYLDLLPLGFEIQAVQQDVDEAHGLAAEREEGVFLHYRLFLFLFHLKILHELRDVQPQVNAFFAIQAGIRVRFVKKSGKLVLPFLDLDDISVFIFIKSQVGLKLMLFDFRVKVQDFGFQLVQRVRHFFLPVAVRRADRFPAQIRNYISNFFKATSITEPSCRAYI